MRGLLRRILGLVNPRKDEEVATPYRQTFPTPLPEEPPPAPVSEDPPSPIA